MIRPMGEGNAIRSMPAALVKLVVAAAWFLAAASLAAGAEPAAESSLDLPDHGQFVQITISEHSWEGDRQGVSLKADGSWSSWSEGHSGMFPTRPTVDIILPPEAARRAVQLIRELKLPLTPHTEQERPPTKSTTVEWLLTTTEGVFDLGADRRLEEFLQSLRFYVGEKGVLKTVDVPLSADPKEKRRLVLDCQGTLKLIQPGRSAPLRTWRLSPDRLAEVTEALPREAWMGSKGSGSLRLTTDRGEFNAPTGDGAVAELLRDSYRQEIGLEITPGGKFAEIRLRVGTDDHAGTTAYFFVLNARGELLAAVDIPKRSPVEVDGGRKTVKVPLTEIHGLVKSIAQKSVWSRRREGNPPGAKLPNGLFKVVEVIVNQSRFFTVPDPDGAIEKKLIELYTKYRDSPR